MTTGPGDDVAAGRGHLRASDADREQVIEVLKAAFAHGGLAKDEFEARIGQTFGSQTYAELADVTAGLTRAQPVRTPTGAQAGKAAVRGPAGPARARVKKAAAWGTYGIVLPALLRPFSSPVTQTLRLRSPGPPSSIWFSGWSVRLY